MAVRVSKLEAGSIQRRSVTDRRPSGRRTTETFTSDTAGGGGGEWAEGRPPRSGSGTGGRIFAAAQQQWLRFQIVDSGVGMSPSAVEALFQPFSQVLSLAQFYAQCA